MKKIYFRIKELVLCLDRGMWLMIPAINKGERGKKENNQLLTMR